MVSADTESQKNEQQTRFHKFEHISKSTIIYDIVQFMLSRTTNTNVKLSDDAKLIGSFLRKPFCIFDKQR